MSLSFVITYFVLWFHFCLWLDFPLIYILVLFIKNTFSALITCKQFLSIDSFLLISLGRFCWSLLLKWNTHQYFNRFSYLPFLEEKNAFKVINFPLWPVLVTTSSNDIYCLIVILFYIACDISFNFLFWAEILLEAFLSIKFYIFLIIY